MWGALYWPHLHEGFIEGIKNGTIDNLKPDDIFTANLRQAVREQAYAEAALAVGVTQDKLQKEIAEAVSQGEGVNQLADRIEELFGSWAGYRPERIARTEITPVLNGGHHAALVQQGFQEKEWRTVLDGATRPTHHNAHKQRVPVNGTFTIGGQSARYPGDTNLSAKERIHCRCAIVGAGIPEDRKQQFDQMFTRAHGALERRFMLSLQRALKEQRDRVLSRLS